MCIRDRSDTSRVFAADYICNLFREAERFFIYNLRVFNNIDGDVMVNESEDIKIHEVNRALDFHNVFFAHLIALCIFDNCNTAVKLIKMQIFIYFHASACLDAVSYTHLDGKNRKGD